MSVTGKLEYPMIRLVEHNENEGESWVFFFNCPEKLFIEFQEFLERNDEWSSYKLEMLEPRFNKEYVEDLLSIAGNGTGYMDQHSYVGTLTHIPDTIDDIYKGDIYKFCVCESKEVPFITEKNDLDYSTSEFKWESEEFDDFMRS